MQWHLEPNKSPPASIFCGMPSDLEVPGKRLDALEEIHKLYMVCAGDLLRIPPRKDVIWSKSSRGRLRKSSNLSHAQDWQCHGIFTPKQPSMGSVLQQQRAASRGWEKLHLNSPSCTLSSLLLHRQAPATCSKDLDRNASWAQVCWKLSYLKKVLMGESCRAKVSQHSASCIPCSEPQR